MRKTGSEPVDDVDMLNRTDRKMTVLFFFPAFKLFETTEKAHRPGFGMPQLLPDDRSVKQEIVNA